MHTLNVRNRRNLAVFVAAVSALISLAAGCTDLKVTRVNPAHPEKAKGFQYALPKPFLQVVPQEDGSVKVEVIYLPDEENTYAIDVGGAMDDREIAIKVDDAGMLRQVAFKADTTVVAAGFATLAGEASKQTLERINARTAADEAAEKKAKDDRATEVKELEGKIETANTEVEQAREAQVNASKELKKAQDALAADPGNAELNDAVREKQEALDAASQALSKKQRELDKLTAALKDLNKKPLKVEKPGINLENTADIISGAGQGKRATKPPKFATVPGPVLYAVVEGVEGGKPVLQLRSVGVGGFDGKQMKFRTTDFGTGSGTGDGSSPGGPLSIEATPEASPIKTGDPLVLTFDRGVKSVIGVSIVTKPTGATTSVKDTPLANGKLTVNFNAPHAGDYVLKVTVQDDAGQRAIDKEVKFSMSDQPQ